MKRSLLFAFVITIILAFSVGAIAGSATLTTLAGFDQLFQTGGLGASLNALRCSQYGLPGNCVSVTAGGPVPACVPVPLAKDPNTGFGVFRSCTIYTLDGPGEAAFAQDLLNTAVVGVFNNYTQQSLNTSFCSAWKSATPSAQATALTDLGASAGLFPPCP